MIILLSFVMCFRSIGRFHVNNVYICTSITNIVYMSDRQQFIIDCTSLIPVIGTLVLIKIANEQMVTIGGVSQLLSVRGKGKKTSFNMQ